MDETPRKPRPPVLTALALTVVLAGLCAPCPISNTLLLRPLLAHFDPRYVSGRIAPVPFDRDRWPTGRAQHRAGMAQHLIESGVLVGKTRAQLVEMLGEPDGRPGRDGSRWLLGYSAKGLFDETLWLEVTFGEDGTASRGSSLWTGMTRVNGETAGGSSRADRLRDRPRVADAR
jgi:hypothetical protein